MKNRKFININENSKIYILCPAYIKTGGPELLHQLTYELNNNNYNAYITYYGFDENDKNYTCPDFKKYIDSFKTIKEIDDNDNNIIISPESVTAIKFMEQFNECKKVIWWLSVDNFTKHFGIIKPIQTFGIKRFIKLVLDRKLIYNFKKIKNVPYHLCQSHYAIDFLKLKKISNENIAYLSDYISKEYLEINEKDWPKKENIVLYNPKKGYKYTKKIINQAKNIKFIPIQNLTTEEVKSLLLKSKVYIDFGNHPGKDRFPREAAVCGCCVITGKKGSANYHNHVPIDDEFKFEGNKSNITSIIEKINNCLNDYDNEIKKFEEYREFIYGEKDNFKKDVKTIFMD